MRIDSALLFTVAALMAPPCFAGGAQAGLVTNIAVRASDGLNIIYLSGSPTGRPACATEPYWLIRDENSNTGKKQLAMLLAAQAANRPVTIMGAGTCVRWKDGEDIEAVSIPTP